MGRIIDARGEEAIDVLTELIEPVTSIASDPDISAMMRGGKASVASFVTAILRTHKSDVIQIFAVDDGVSVEEEKKLMSVLTIPARALKLFSNPEVKEMFFGAAAATESATGSSAASENGRG